MGMMKEIQTMNKEISRLEDLLNKTVHRAEKAEFDAVYQEAYSNFDRHPDDIAIDQFASDMKRKMKASRDKGRSGWDDPNTFDTDIANIFVNHLFKDNENNYLDLANLLMMLHIRKDRPGVVKDCLLTAINDPSLHQPDQQRNRQFS